MEFDYEASLERLKLQQKKLDALFQAKKLEAEEARIRNAQSIRIAQKLLDRINKQND